MLYRVELFDGADTLPLSLGYVVESGHAIFNEWWWHACGCESQKLK